MLAADAFLPLLASAQCLNNAPIFGKSVSTNQRHVLPSRTCGWWGNFRVNPGFPGLQRWFASYWCTLPWLLMLHTKPPFRACYIWDNTSMHIKLLATDQPVIWKFTEDPGAWYVDCEKSRRRVPPVFIWFFFLSKVFSLCFCISIFYNRDWCDNACTCCTSKKLK